MGSNYLMDRASVRESEAFLELDGGNGYKTKWMDTMPLNFTLKKGKRISFMFTLSQWNIADISLRNVWSCKLFPCQLLPKIYFLIGNKVG